MAERPRLRDRLAAHWRARGLDRALAEGIAPEASAALALRAQRLTEPDRRWAIAGALRRILREAEGAHPPRPARVRPNSRAVNGARQELNELAATLEDPGPLAAHGVAEAWFLLTDGTGPLYNPLSRVPLCTRARQAAQNARPWTA